MEKEIGLTFYSPSAIISTFNAALQNLTERKILLIKGVYQFFEGPKYGGYYYDKLKDEATDRSIKLLVPELLRKDLKNNTTIEVRGYVARKLDNYGRIELQIVITELLEQKANKFSDEDIKKIDLLNRKTEEGFKDLDSLIKKKIFDQQRIIIHIIMGKNAIIDNDIKKQLSEGIALYNIQFHKVSLTTPAEIISKITALDSAGADVICLSRGGGENLEVFDKPEICEAALKRTSIIASAIGHADNITLFEKVSDKKFTTPTAFGQYLKEIYNNTVNDFEQSKAKLAEDIKKTLEANFLKQISNLNQQLTAVKELSSKTLADKEVLYQKTLIEAKAVHTTQVDGLKKQIEVAQAQFTLHLQEQKKVLNEKENNLNNHIQSLVKEKEEKDRLLLQAKNISDQFKANNDLLQKQISSQTSTNWTTLAIAVLVALIFGAILGKTLF